MRNQDGLLVPSAFPWDTHGAGGPGCELIPTEALGLSTGLMEWGGGPDGHAGCLVSTQGLGAQGITHCMMRDEEKAV